MTSMPTWTQRETLSQGQISMDEIRNSLIALRDAARSLAEVTDSVADLRVVERREALITAIYESEKVVPPVGLLNRERD
jgi:hypothetical protein